MQDSNRDAGPRLFQGVPHINATNGVFNQAGRDQYNNYNNNYNNAVNNEMVADAYLDKLPRALRAGYSSGNHKPCIKGTREGVLCDIEAWEADKNNKSVYWLKGVAGCGKSTVAQTFAERSAAHSNLGASFFCSRDYPDRRNLGLIFLTLAYDLAYWCPDFKTALVPIVRTNPNVQYDSLPVQLEKLLVRPFKQTGLSTTIVIDALDECEDKEPVSEFLSALAVHVDDMPTVKFFVTGRPEDRIRSGFKLPSLQTKELPLHDVDSLTVDSDIKSFVETRLQEIATRRRHCISGHWPSDRDIATILRKTSGLFIIASVIIRFIDSPYVSPQKRLKLIVDLPNSTIYEGKSGIDVVYHQILSASFEHVDEDDPDFFDRLHLVVGSIVLALKPLRRASLAEILEMTPESIWTILRHLHSVLIVPESESEPIRILHKSFADFITDIQRCPDGRYCVDTPTHHSELAVYCLKLMKTRLMKNICRLPRYALNCDVRDLPARREQYIGAPLSYACSSWAKHLQLSSKAGDDKTTVLKLVDDFLAHHLLSWLEILSTEEHLHIAIYSLGDLRLWLINSPARGLLDLIDDCERFVLRSFEGIEQSAMHIYHSAIPWAPTSSLTRKLYEPVLITETKLLNAVDAAWDACIRITSVGEPAKAVVFSHNGGLIAAQCVPGDPQDLLGPSRVKVFDAMTGAIRATFEERKRTYSIAFSPDDDLLASGLLHGTIHIWDVRTGTLFKMLEGHSWEVCSVAFSPCSTMIASGSRDRTVRIWSIPSGHCNCVLMGHSGVVTDVCWLETGGKVISSSVDRTVRIWDVQKQTCSKIFAEYARRVTTITLSPRLFLMAFDDGEVKVYDSQSCEIIRSISCDGLIQPRFSPGGDEVFLTGRNAGYIWDLTKTTPVWAIDYSGDYATFSPDGTRIASIYGNFLKIWKTETGYKHHNTSTHIHDKALANVYISLDEQLVASDSMKGVQNLNATTDLHFSTFVPDDRKTIISSIVFLPNSEFVSCFLEGVCGLPRRVCLRYGRRLPGSAPIWKTHNHQEDMTIEVDNDVFHIALSSNGNQLFCLSSSNIKLLDLEKEEGERSLAQLELDDYPLPQDCRFAIDGMMVSIESGGRTRSWLISPNTNEGSLLPMVFVPITHGRLYQSQDPDVFARSQSYRCDKDGEWILDQHGSHVLWIPPDERPGRIWSKRCGRKVVVRTEGGKIDIVDF